MVLFFNNKTEEATETKKWFFSRIWSSFLIIVKIPEGHIRIFGIHKFEKILEMTRNKGLIRSRINVLIAIVYNHFEEKQRA